MASLPLPTLYFYSLNSAESPAFYSSDSPPTHTHVHTHVHTPYTPTHTFLHTHTPTHTPTHTLHTPIQTHLQTHINTHPCTHTPTHTLVWTSTNLGCPVLGSPLLWTRCTLSLPHSPPSSPSGFSLQSRSLAGEVHQELLSQGRHPHNAWETPVEPHEDCKPPGDTFEMF